MPLNNDTPKLNPAAPSVVAGSVGHLEAMLNQTEFNRAQAEAICRRAGVALPTPDLFGGSFSRQVIKAACSKSGPKQTRVL